MKQGYKQTKVGVIPEEWEVNSIKDLKVSVKSGSNKIKSEEGKYKVYGSTGGIGYADNYVYDEKLILCARVGANAGYIYSIEEKCDVSDNTLIMSKFNNIIPKYLEESLIRYNLNRLVFGSGQPLVTGTLLKNIQLPIPPLPEQERIASCLSTWDKGIEKLSSLIEAKKQQKKGLMQQLLTGKKRLDGFREEWRRIELKECLSYEQPTKYLENDFNEIQSDSKTPVLTANQSFILGYTNSKEGIYKDLPVIIFDDFTTASRFVDFNFKVKSSAIKFLKPKSDYNLKFIFERLQIIKHDISTHKRRWISEFENMVLPIPSIEEQIAIANILSKADQEIDLLEKKLVALQAQKKGLMQVLLTGKKRLIIND